MIASLVLAAGLGTRLGRLSRWRAKPLLPVGDRPALAHVLAQVRPWSSAIVVNAFHRAEDVEAFAQAEGIAVSREVRLAGTAGAMALARDRLGPGDVLVWNGDMVGEVDVAAVLAAHEAGQRRGAVATLVVRRAARPLGDVGVDPSGRVLRVRGEAPARGEATSADFVGIYVIAHELRRAFPSSGGVIEDVLLPAIGRGARVEVVATGAALIDIGTPRGYRAANQAWLARRNTTHWAHPGARVDAGVALEGTVVGAGARVVGNGVVRGSVVWPGAEVEAPLVDAIVAPEGTVPVA